MFKNRKTRSKRMSWFRMHRSKFRLFQLLFHLFTVLEFQREPEVAAVEVRVKIPIGFVFDKNNEEIQRAFAVAATELSKRDGPGRLDFEMYVDVINTADTFKLSRLICNQFSKNVAMVLGSVPTDAFPTFHSYANTFGIPFITPSFSTNAVAKPNFVDYATSIIPDYHQAVLDIIEYYGWTNIYYIYDSNDGLLRLQQIYETIEVVATRKFRIAHVKKVITAAEAVEFLAGIENQDRWSEKVVIVDAPGALCRDILVQHVRDIRLGRRNYHYFFTDIVMDENWSDRELGAIRVTGFKLLDETRPQVKSFRTFWKQDYISATAAVFRDIVVMTCEELNTWYQKSPDIFEVISKVVATLSTTNYECNPPTPLNEYHFGDKTAKMLQSIEFDGITGHIAFDSRGIRKNFTLQVVELTSDKTMKKIGTWYDYKGFLPIHPPKPKMTPGQYDRNKTYIITTVEEPPYVMRNTETHGMPLPFNYRGFCVELTERLCEMMEIKCQIRLSFDGLYGLKDPHMEGGWNGAIGELIREEADMAIASIMVTMERELVVDFSKPFLTLDKKKAKSYNYFVNNFALFSPFAIAIWYCITGAAILAAIVLWVVSRFSTAEWRVLSVHQPRNGNTSSRNAQSPNKGITAHIRNQFSFLNCLWYTYSTMLQQSTGLSPRALSGRCVSLSLWIFSWFLISTYIASLGASIVLTEVNYPANELVKTARCPRDTPYGPGPLIPAQAVEQQNWLYYVDEQGRSPDNCEVIINIHKPGMQEYAVAFPRGSKLRNGVNIALQILKYDGKLESMITKWFVRDECGTAERFPHAQELSLYHVAGIFYILIGGLVLALIVALVEYLLHGRADKASANWTVRTLFAAMTGNVESRTPSVQVSQSEREDEVQNESERADWNGGAYAGYYSPSSENQEETELGASFSTVCCHVREDQPSPPPPRSTLRRRLSDSIELYQL